MTLDFLKRHAEELQKNARATAERAARDPSNFWLNVAAENQRQAALEAVRRLELAEAEAATDPDNLTRPR